MSAVATDITAAEAQRERAAAAAAADGRRAGPPEPSFFGLLRDLLGDLPGLVSDRVHLLALELRRAGLAMAQIVALVVAAAVLLITAWLALWVGVAAALIQADVPWGWVLVGVLAVNLIAAAFALLRARGLARLLTLPATVRRLTVPRSTANLATSGGPDRPPPASGDMHAATGPGQPLHS